MSTHHTELLLALDYGGTKLAAAVAHRGAREWLAIDRHASPPNHAARYEQATMLTLARQLLAGRTPSAIGVSFGGPVDAARGRVILSHHIPGWADTPLRDQLQNEFGAPVSIENDANIAALGEYTFGAGQGCASLFYVTVSTGVGGGFMIDGKIYRGADAMAGEIGHTIVDPQGARCVCGRTISPTEENDSPKISRGDNVQRRGCVEALACGPAIARRASELLNQNPHAGKILRESSGTAMTGALVARAANEGDELAQRVMDEAARALGWGIGTVITLLNPERIVVGGGITKSGERWWRVVREAARANTLPQMRVEIVPAAFSDDAPLWGALALAESLL